MDEKLKDVFDPDKPEFILCDICRFWQHGRCIKKNSLINTARPSDGDFLGGLYGICKEFKGPSTPIPPLKFAELMKKYISLTYVERDSEEMRGDDILRYRLEFLMCEMLKELGYGDGAKVFINVGFDCPF